MDEMCLVHYGVKGMKWGIRKDRKKGSNKTKKRKEDISQLSNEELQTRIRRMQLENQYTELSAKKKSAGKVILTGILMNAGKEVAKNYISKKMGIKLNSLDDSLTSAFENETSHTANMIRLKKLGLI